MRSKYEHKQLRAVSRYALYRVMTFLVIACTISPASSEGVEFVEIRLKLGKIADYGASPWYTTDVKIAGSGQKLIFDSGANFNWATSSSCHTPACDAHQKVDDGYVRVLEKSSEAVSFGSWGTIDAHMVNGFYGFDTASTNSISAKSANMNFFLATDYTGNQFETLAWGGGVSLLSDTREMRESTKGIFKYKSTFVLGALKSAGSINGMEFSMVTDRVSKSGMLFLGSGGGADLHTNVSVTLPPKGLAKDLNYLWGTELYEVKIGSTSLGSLHDGTFIMDSGSSHFKGDEANILPILNHFWGLRDRGGYLIFEKVFEENQKHVLQWTGLRYKNGGPDDYASTLPEFSIKIGNKCGSKINRGRGVVTLSPSQYSYKVDVGERAGSYVLAFHVLDGVPGILVGSTFQDLVFSTYTYNGPFQEPLSGNYYYTQSDMFIYQKALGEQPSGFICTPI